jgi:hypothetical protein
VYGVWAFANMGGISSCSRTRFHNHLIEPELDRLTPDNRNGQRARDTFVRMMK